MATPSRATVTIDGHKFDALTASVNFSTDKDHAGIPQMGSLSAAVIVWADMHDTTNIPFATVQSLFNLANLVTTPKIVAMKIEYWIDDSHQDSLLTYSFQGWVQRFETSNPLDFIPGEHTHDIAERLTDGVPPDVNHLMRLDLQPALNTASYQAVTVSN